MRDCKSLPRLIVLAALVLLVPACALSPQTVRVHPSLDVAQLSPRTQGATIALSVRDARPDQVVGYRGGVYATASITTDAGAAAAMRAELGRALGQLGYQVMDEGAAATIALKVELAELRYAVTEESVTRTIETVATVRAESNSGTITRTGEYRDRRTKEVVKVPSAAENETLLNDVLSAALQQLVADPELLKF